ncbi:MAG: alpha-galactosidase, partial [Candidatus Scatosoma sp.]
MNLITIKENGIYVVFGRSDKKIYLLHLSDREFDEELLKDQEIAWEQYRLFEVQVSGKNQSTHRGGKNIVSSEGVEADFIDMKDFRNDFGRKIEVTQRSGDTEVISHYQFFNGVKAVKSWTEVTNISTRTLFIEHVSSFCLYGLCKECGKNNYDSLALWQSYNSWYCEGQWARRMIREYGVLRVNGLHSMARALVSNTGGWSTKEFLPMGAVENVKTGTIMLWQIESGGSWNYEVSACFNELYVNLFGPSGFENQWYKKLCPEEKFISDAATVTFGSEKIENAIAEMIQYRRIIRRDYPEYRNLPVIYNPYMHDAWDYPYADHMEEVARGAGELGADVFCIDAGWHDEDDIMKYIGIWRESKTRYPLTLCKTLNYIRSLGLKIGLWLEIETVGMYSPLRKIFSRDCFFLRNGEIPVNN